MQAPGANRSFADLLAAFTQAIVANDGAGLGALFAPAESMSTSSLARIAAARRSLRCCNGFTTPAATIAGTFSTRSATAGSAMPGSASAIGRLLPESAGRPVLFEGISQFLLRGRADPALWRGVRPRRRAGAARFSGRAHPTDRRESRRLADRHAGGARPSRPVFDLTDRPARTAVDHRLRRAEIIRRIGQRAQLLGAERPRDLRGFEQHVVERPVALDRGAAGVVDEIVRLVAPGVRAPAPSSPPRRRSDRASCRGSSPCGPGSTISPPSMNSA